MQYNLARTAPIAIVLLLSGCSIIDHIRYSVAEYTGRLAAVQCALSATERQANLAAVNGWLATNGRQSRVPALDCDGDGTPDP